MRNTLAPSMNDSDQGEPMPKAGFCAECGENVWLRADGSCERGHSATSVSRQYDSPAPAESVIESEPLTGPKPKRRRILVAGAVALVVVLIALCGAGAALLRPLANKGSSAASEWSARLSEDYPGWKQVGFNVRSFSGTGGSETTYDFSLIPPGRDFAVGVTYKSSDGASPVSQDEVFRSGGAFADRSSSLLDYIDANYAQNGRDVTSVASDAKGEAIVTWRKVSGFLFFTWTTGSFDELSYNEGARAWSVAFSPGK
jgi:hypothetical protein